MNESLADKSEASDTVLRDQLDHPLSTDFLHDSSRFHFTSGSRGKTLLR